MSTERKMAAAALLISVFVAGALGGAAVMQLVSSRGQDELVTFDRRGGRPPLEMRPMMPPGDSLGKPLGFAPMWLTDRFSRRLGLTEEQQDSIRGILERQQEEASAMLEEIHPRLRAHLDSVRAQIRAVLTEEQVEMFDRFEREGGHMFMRGLDGRGRGRPPSL